MKQKRKTPYQMLLEEARKFAISVRCRHEKPMWWYPKDKLSEGWALAGLNQRVAAAEQLGYNVILKSTDEGLCVQYIKKIPDAPLGWNV